MSETAENRTPSGKQEKGSEEDKRKEEEPLCLVGPGYIKSGLGSPVLAGVEFTRRNT